MLSKLWALSSFIDNFNLLSNMLTTVCFFLLRSNALVSSENKDYNIMQGMLRIEMTLMKKLFQATLDNITRVRN